MTKKERETMNELLKQVAYLEAERRMYPYRFNVIETPYSQQGEPATATMVYCQGVCAIPGKEKIFSKKEYITETAFRLTKGDIADRVRQHVAMQVAQSIVKYVYSKP